MYNTYFEFVISFTYFLGTLYAVLALVRMDISDVLKSVSAGAFDTRELDVLKQRHYARTGIIFIFSAFAFEGINILVNIKDLTMFCIIACIHILIIVIIYVCSKLKYFNDLSNLKNWRTSMEMQQQNNSKSQKKDRSEEIDDIDDNLFLFLEELSIMKYNSEIQRQDSLIKQSSQMQTMFSIITAAIFMVVPIMIEYRGQIKINYIFSAISTIIFCMLLSLVTSSLAQLRYKYAMLDDIEILNEGIAENYETFKCSKVRIQHKVDILSVIQKRLTLVNDKRAFFISISFYFFYASIVLIVIWFTVAIFLLFN